MRSPIDTNLGYLSSYTDIDCVYQKGKSVETVQ